jgi:predicted aldo/keto reductase-like oxidoreductase
MIYRPFGKTGIQLSQLGFGCMRFPLTEQFDPTKIDEVEATEMLHYAIEHGVNYFDTAYPYHRETSEQFTGKALKGGYRKKIHLATKAPMWLVKCKDDMQKYFDEQCKRLQTDMIDMYLLHALGKNSWKTVKECDVFSFLEAMLKAGRIRYAGFSFHDELPLFKEIVDAYPWTFCLIHLNYVDDDYQAGLEGLEYAHRKGLAVIIMEPLRGGKLANNVLHEVADTIKQTGRTQTAAEFALRWLFNRPEVCCVLSGMSSLEQVKENITFASEEHTNTITPQEMKLYKKARTFYRKRTKVNCTQCGYCMPCPQKIAIPFILELYNDACVYEAYDNSQWMYEVFVKPENRADQCTECRECEEKCPQKIPIAECMKKAHETLARDD